MTRLYRPLLIALLLATPFIIALLALRFAPEIADFLKDRESAFYDDLDRNPVLRDQIAAQWLGVDRLPGSFRCVGLVRLPVAESPMLVTLADAAPSEDRETVMRIEWLPKGESEQFRFIEGWSLRNRRFTGQVEDRGSVDVNGTQRNYVSMSVPKFRTTVFAYECEEHDIGDSLIVMISIPVNKPSTATAAAALAESILPCKPPAAPPAVPPRRCEPEGADAEVVRRLELDVVALKDGLPDTISIRESGEVRGQYVQRTITLKGPVGAASTVFDALERQSALHGVEELRLTDSDFVIGVSAYAVVPRCAETEPYGALGLISDDLHKGALPPFPSRAIVQLFDREHGTLSHGFARYTQEPPGLFIVSGRMRQDEEALRASVPNALKLMDLDVADPWAILRLDLADDRDY